MDKLPAIEFLRSVLLVEKKTLPPNIMRVQKSRQAAKPPAPVAVAAPKPTSPIEEPMPDLDAAYISDDDDVEATPPSPRSWSSRRVITQQHQDERDKLHRISFVAAHNPYLAIKENRPTRGLGGVNVNLQLSEWAYAQHISGEVIDDDTGEQLEYRKIVSPLVPSLGLLSNCIVKLSSCFNNSVGGGELGNGNGVVFEFHIVGHPLCTCG